MARVPYRRRQDAGGEDTAIFDRLEAERRVPTPHVFLAMTHAPVQLDGLLTYARALRQATELGPRLRELVILAVAHAKKGDYIGRHHERDALAAGLTPEQLAAVPAPDHDPDLFTEPERAVIAVGRAAGADTDVPDEVWDTAARHLTDRQLVQLVLTASWYASGVITTRLLGIDLEDDHRSQEGDANPDGHLDH